MLAVPLAHAQAVQLAVGNIQGTDVSIASSASAISVPQDSSTVGAIANGDVITLGPGQARLMLTLGGEIDICGPAKLTLVQSGEAITVGLDFGTLRLQLPASRNLRVFTPAIIATPLEINGTPGDVTVMLTQDDSLSVRAASGALLLESQFTNDKIVVPQSGQFWFAQGRLLPVARTDVACECLLPEALYVLPSSPGAPPIGEITPAQIAAATSPSPAAKPEGERQAEQDEQPGVEYSILAHPNNAHPVEQQPKTAPVQPPELVPFYRVDMPPLAFSASSPMPPPASTEQMIVLIRTAKIDPNFEFTGHVNPPPLDQASKSANQGKSRAGQMKPAAEKHGFWARLKRFFGGGSS
jgi:hypothetical protein